MNTRLAQRVIEEAIRHGVREFCVAPGSRNAPLVYALAKTSQAKTYYWGEERSSAFFALGRIKATERPVAVIVTSGTAAAELLPAAMSAHYLGQPLLLITADRPRRFRGTGAPQTAEQQGLFGCYAHDEQDLAFDDVCDLSRWTCQGPAHINVCFEEPNEAECQQIELSQDIPVIWPKTVKNQNEWSIDPLVSFIEKVCYPLIVVGALPSSCKEEAIAFLLNLGMPIYAEANSGLREDGRLEPLRITRIDKIWREASKYQYPIDGILRLGEVPTARLWRDLEEQEGKIAVCSISHLPFSGISWAGSICAPFDQFFQMASKLSLNKHYHFQEWLKADQRFQISLKQLFLEEPQAEPSLFYALSKALPHHSNVYVGNSLPIREWDLSATYEDRNYIVSASRGVNGIDGQISTFLGLCDPLKDNWAIIGDLTALYDMAGPWILSQLEHHSINLVIVNNNGGQIFSRMYSMPAFTNPHQLTFSHLARFWNMNYERWESIPKTIERQTGARLIELTPDPQATARFWSRMNT